MPCSSYPPDFEHYLRDAGPCILPYGHDNNGTTHVSELPDGRMVTWDAFECAYPEDCQYDGGECCVTWGYIDPEQYRRR